MKKIFLLMTIVTFAMLANVNLKAQDWSNFGTIEPCTGTHMIGCDWGPALAETIYFDGCPNCPVIIEYHTKKCDGNFAIQITALYKVRIQPGYENMLCYGCLGNLDKKIHTCYITLFQEYHKITANSNDNFFMNQKTCYKNYGMSVNDVYTINIPIISFVNRDPQLFPVNPLDPSSVAVQVCGGYQVCESACCCFLLEDYWVQDSVLQALYCEQPCSINEDYDCPTGCIGGCEDMVFSWSKLHGLIDPDNPSPKKAIANGEFNKNISIIPNPNKGSFQITLTDKTKGNLTIKLSDINGKILQTYNFNKQNEDFSSNFLINEVDGTYILLFELNGTYLGSQKIIINK